MHRLRAIKTWIEHSSSPTSHPRTRPLAAGFANARRLLVAHGLLSFRRRIIVSGMKKWEEMEDLR